MSQAANLIDSICNMYEESTSPDAEERRLDLLQQASELGGQEFSEFVRWIAQQRGPEGVKNITDPQEIMQGLHPWQLQMIVSKFRTPAISPRA
jgi:hypothetical protein